MRISERLKKIREAKGLSQKQFAETLGTVLTRISEYERDKLKPTTETLTKLAEIHGININWLLTGNGNMFIEKEKKSNTKANEIIEAYEKLPEDKQKYYYFKIIADSLEPITKTEETRENTSVFTD